MKTKYKIILANVLYRFIRIFLFKKKIRVSRNNINWFLDLNEGIDLSIFIFGNFDKSILKMSKQLNINDKIDIIDIGSNMGVHTLNFATNYINSKIYSIEPTNYAYEKLLKNLSLNPSIKNVTTSQLFISESRDKPKDIYSSWDLTSREQKHEKHFGVKKSISFAKVMSLDEFILSSNINTKTLIKCDVDGHELSVFKSGKQYLLEHKPFIIMELAPYLYTENGYKSEDLLEYLKSLNYNFYDANTFKEVLNISEYTKNIKDGSSENILLM